MNIEDLKVGKIVKCDIINLKTRERLGRTVFVRVHSFYAACPGNVIVKTIGSPVRTEEVETQYLHEMPKSPPEPSRPERKKNRK